MAKSLFPKFDLKHILILLLLFETLLLIFVLNLAKKNITPNVSISEFKVDLGKNYSFLIDDERFPVEAAPGQFVRIEVLDNNEHPLVFLPEGRSRINFESEHAAMAKVQESRFQFYFNTPEELQTLRNNENLDSLLGKSDWETILKLLHWTRDQFAPGTPRDYPSQDAAQLLPLLRSKKEEGFCAQYCYILSQSLQSLGYFTRQITIQGHEVLEVWVPQFKKWVCLDPLNEAYFEDGEGNKLSAFEISQKRDGSKVVSRIYKDTDEELLGRFQILYFWLRNDLVTNPINIYDLNKYRVRLFLPGNNFEKIGRGDLLTIYPEELYNPPQGIK